MYVFSRLGFSCAISSICNSLPIPIFTWLIFSPFRLWLKQDHFLIKVDFSDTWKKSGLLAEYSKVPYESPMKTLHTLECCLLNACLSHYVSRYRTGLFLSLICAQGLSTKTLLDNQPTNQTNKWMNELLIKPILHALSCVPGSDFLPDLGSNVSPQTEDMQCNINLMWRQTLES